jgi:cadmium resistance protein CadD (predicted permease)
LIAGAHEGDRKLEIFILAIALFASTNVDDLFVLVGFFADPTFRSRDVAIGQYIGIAILFVFSLAGSLLSLVISRAYIGLLGIIAVAIGVKKLVEVLRNSRTDRQNAAPLNRLGKYAQSTTVALITLANGSDNIGVYMPAFAVHSGFQIVIFGVVFLLMTGLWCFLAYSLVHHPTIGAPVRQFGKPLAALVLIGIGILVMYEAGSFALIVH